MRDLTEVKDIKDFEGLYSWICKQKIPPKDRRILYEMVDLACKLNSKWLKERGGSY